jgi:hypothetical protein
MPCKHYKDALVETAASGAEPRGELRAHLAECADCRAAFEEEQALFASINAGLHITANSEVPASLLPRVRARLDEESAPRRIWVSNWFVLASAAVMVVAFFAARVLWRPNVARQPVEMAVKESAPPRVIASPKNHDSVLAPPVEETSPSHRREAIAKSHSARQLVAGGRNTPEVLVPRDQEVLLAEYAEQWNLHKHPLLLAQEFGATILLPLQVAPIQIDELGVKLLADERPQ